jgi:hypothetical protein
VPPGKLTAEIESQRSSPLTSTGHGLRAVRVSGRTGRDRDSSLQHLPAPDQLTDRPAERLRRLHAERLRGCRVPKPDEAVAVEEEDAVVDELERLGRMSARLSRAVEPRVVERE